MFMGGTIEQWIDLSEYCLIISILGIIMVCTSAYLSSWMIQEERRKDKLYEIEKKNKKQWFYDVA